LGTVNRGFQLWLLLLLIYGIAFASRYPREATAGLYIFLFFGLISMSTARISSLREVHGAKIPRFGSKWLLGIALSGLVVVGTAVAAGWFASSQVVALVVRVFIYILSILTALVLTLFIPVFTYLARLIPQVAENIRNLMRSFSGLQMPKMLEDFTIQFGQIVEKALPLIFAGRVIFLLGIVLLVVAFILFGLRLGKQRKLDAEEESAAFQSGAPGSRWTNWLQQVIPSGLRMRFKSPAQMLAAARIRIIYSQLMVLSQKMGNQRPPSATPYEFLPSLETLLPEEQEQLNQITAAYVKIRYGEYPETMQEVEAVQAAWESVQRKGNKNLAALKRSRRQKAS
jgi:hypothetical protein